MSRDRFTFIDLFAGIGGFRIPFDEIGGKCVFSAEIDAYARRTYRANFPPEMSMAWDIRPWEAKDIPAHDVLLAGFPCQPFSKSGVSKLRSMGRPDGFDDTRGTLFFDVVRIAAFHRPRVILLENVPGLFSHNGGETFKTIMRTLRDLDYHAHHILVNTKHWTPQKRERVFIVAHRELDEVPCWPTLKYAPMRLGLSPKLGDILERRVDPKYTLGEKTWAYLQRHREKHDAKRSGFSYTICKRSQQTRTLSARYGKDGSEILVAQRGKPPRRLTPRECARLMGFPDSFRIVCSDTQAYRQFGNAVSPCAVRAVREYALHGVKW